MIRTVTIGIVEDHEKMRAALKLFLTACNYRVTIEAKHGEDLFERIAESSELPVICFVNANMPVMDGCATVLKLKESYPMIKVIAYSDDERKGKKMLKLGAHEYLPKHSEADIVIKCIEKLLKS